MSKTIGGLGEYNILSIKRERDGQVFSIDDNVIYENGVWRGRIKVIYTKYFQDEGINLIVDIHEGLNILSCNLMRVEHTKHKIYKITDFL